jgi:hypothetical protein
VLGVSKAFVHFYICMLYCHKIVLKQLTACKPLHKASITHTSNTEVFVKLSCHQSEGHKISLEGLDWQLGVVVHACHPSTWEAGAEG